MITSKSDNSLFDTSLAFEANASAQSSQGRSPQLAATQPILKFAPAGNTGSLNSFSFIDLDDIFADHFFPDDIDFANFFGNDSVNLDQGDTSDLIDFNSTYDHETLDNFDGSEIIMKEEYPSLTQILIPPIVPGSATATSTANNSAATQARITLASRTASNIQQVLAMSKFNRPNKGVKIESPVSSDNESDDDNSEQKPLVGRKRKGPKGEFQSGDQQKVERRERNREHAKKSRVRKKMMLETLSDQLSALRYENVNLRRVVAERIPHLAPKILNDCTTVESSLLNNTWPMQDINLAPGGPRQQYAKILMEPDFRLIQALLHSQQNFVLSDPSLQDNPIVYASEGFCKLTGYKRQDVLGRNCRFLQGPGTDQNAVDLIRKGVADGRDISVCLLNYKADGTPFWNQFFVAALRDAEGNVVNFVGIQCEVTSLPISEIKDRVKKLPIPVGM